MVFLVYNFVLSINQFFRHFFCCITQEDWANFDLGADGSISARLLKPCPRCTVPARAPFTGRWHFQARPLLAPQVYCGLFPWCVLSFASCSVCVPCCTFSHDLGCDVLAPHTDGFAQVLACEMQGCGVGSGVGRPYIWRAFGHRYQCQGRNCSQTSPSSRRLHSSFPSEES